MQPAFCSQARRSAPSAQTEPGGLWQAVRQTFIWNRRVWGNSSQTSFTVNFAATRTLVMTMMKVFVLEEKMAQIEVLRDMTPGIGCQAAYRLALQQAIVSAGLRPKPTAPIQIGVCIVGVEPRKTEQTLPGVMVEAFLRNATLKKSLFIRYGTATRAV
jgi:hypothetical protein